MAKSDPTKDPEFSEGDSPFSADAVEARSAFSESKRRAMRRARPARGTSSTSRANLDHLYLRIEPFDAAAITDYLGTH
jgi:hypothetical protein